MPLCRSSVAPTALAAPERADRLPTVDLSACSACGVCVMVCPTAAVGITFVEDRAWAPSFDAARCIWCFDCEMACPDGAIELPFEIVEEERALS